MEGREDREAMSSVRTQVRLVHGSHVQCENSGQAGPSPVGLQEAEEVPGAMTRRQSRGQDHLASRWDTWVQSSAREGLT